MSTITSLLADMSGWGHMDGWGGGWMWLWTLAVVVLVVAFLVWLVRAGAGSSQGPPADDPERRAREILAERYARGELSTEEYRERLSQLR